VIEHCYQPIPGWFYFAEAYTAAVTRAPSEKPSIFVELGCWRGRSTCFMVVEILRSTKPITFYAIDTFNGSTEHREGIPEELPDLFSSYCENTAQLREIAPRSFFTLRGDSALSAAGFKPESVDFVFIDAEHTEEAVRRDIDAWWPKLKSGGVMGGDDYGLVGVRLAVLRSFSPNGNVYQPDGYPYWEVTKQ